MKLNKLTSVMFIAGMSFCFSSFAATLSMNDDANTISGLNSSQMLSKNNGSTWEAWTDSSKNNFPGAVTVMVAQKDNNAINSVDYDPAATYGTAGTLVRYNGYYWQSQWWADPGRIPGSDPVWLRVGPIQIQNLATFTFTPYSGQKAADLQKEAKDKVAAQRKVIGYFPEWGVYEAHNYFTPDKIDFSQLTHLNYGFAVIKGGEVVIHDTYKGPELLRQLDKLTEQNGVTNMVSVGGWNNSEEGVFEEATRTQEGINKLADSMIAFMQEWGFDGIDIDWEYPDSDAERANFTSLVQTLRSKLDALGLQSDKYFQLSAAVTTNHNNIQYINPETTAPLLDSVNVMAYDIHGAFDSITGHNAPLYANSKDADQKLNVASTLQEYSSTWKVPKNKLMVGIPYYGRGWGNVAPTEIVKGLPGLFASGSATVHGAWDDEGQFTGTNPYYLLKEYAASADWTRYWDSESQVPYLYNAKTKEFLTYDDAESVQKKVNFINQNGYGGAIIWDLSGDTPEHELGEIVEGVLNPPSDVKDFTMVNGRVYTMIEATAQKKSNRYIVKFNGKYLCESYKGDVLYGTKSSSNGITTMGCSTNFVLGDKLTVSLESGSPGLSINTGGPILGELVVSEEHLPSASTEPVKGFAYNKANSRLEAKLEENAQKGENRYVVKKDGKNYICESYKGSVYYSYKSTKNGVVTMSCPIKLEVGSTYSLSAESNMPGYNPNTKGPVLSSFVATADMK
ncbi:glycoside hydrolase family 18 protein [Citrobacter rodentium]|uniref:glycoside hydrolase family 18 protein n=1 Tax=Citrobacter rodentium TaxID=67825 RepID=UPI001C3EAB0E|nr:glycoside hydrolase family 18 protein [Citrobacter rodentium]